MKSFSQRMGKIPVREQIQKESADLELRNELWNALTIYYLNYIKNLESETSPKYNI